MASIRIISGRLLTALCATAIGALVSCNLGPNYSRPALDVPASYKGDRAASGPAATEPHLLTNWWQLFGDEDLNALEEAALQHNPDLRAAVARVAQARAVARQVQSEFYPQISVDPSLTWSITGGGNNARGPTLVTTTGPSVGVTRGGNSSTQVRIPFDLSYEVDLWGQVARSLESADAQTRATADEFAVVLQTLEADVAQDYINLRSLESQDEIFTRDVQLYRQQLDLIKQKLKAGIVGGIDVAQAQTQLDSLVAQQIDIHRQRADAEHALAILVGKPPAEFDVPKRPFVMQAPMIPAGLPAELLRHRPDVMEAEENLVAANAQVGVAITNFYPTLRLSGAAGFESVDVKHALDWQSAILSLGPSLSMPIFEGGRLTAQLAQARGRYNELVETYRSTLLGAFRDVEVSLTDVHERANALEAQHRAVTSSREYLRLAQLEYNQGLESYLQLLDADRTLLSNELTEAQLLNQRLVSTVLLIKALGGGWVPAHPLRLPPSTEPASLIAEFEAASQPARVPATGP